ncbi:MAG: WbqC family protein [Bacteroidota bacterium]
MSSHKKEENIGQLIVDIQYFGTINYIKILFQFSDIEIEQYESYQKMSFRNRCVIAGSNGVVNLSVPLEKGRGQKELMKEVRISHSANWRVQHWRTIESCYSRSPFFEFYRDGVWQLLQKKETFLLDQNLAILSWLKQVLKFSGTISLTDTYLKAYPDEVTDRRNFFLPKNQGKQSIGFRYTQVFEDRIGFQPDLSILDLLFNCGPETISLLKDNILPI